MNQYEYEVNTGRISRDKWHTYFSPEVHVLAGTLVPVVSTNHLVVRKLVGFQCLALHKGAASTYPQVVIAQ